MGSLPTIERMIMAGAAFIISSAKHNRRVNIAPANSILGERFAASAMAEFLAKSAIVQHNDAMNEKNKKDLTLRFSSNFNAILPPCRRARAS
jgi:hypothetical protein